MSGQHTPGPWECDERGYIRAEDGTLVAQAGAVGNAAESVSNGLLLAAAPDFYEAVNGQPDDVSPIAGLIALTRHYEELLRKSVVAGEEEDPLACYEALSEVEALIARLQIATAKAQGNQP